MLREIFAGAGLLLRGFGHWRRNPGVMLLGIVPAVLAWGLVVAALVALGFTLPAMITWLTPFDDAWPQPWPGLIAVAIGTIVFGSAIVLSAVTFTALTLAIGDAFYEQVWRSVELELGGTIPATGAGFWQAVRNSSALIGMGLATALVVAVASALPVVGAVIGPVLGVVLSGRLLAVELCARAFQARGLDAATQRALRRSIRWPLLGFGIATQLLFMIPLGAIATMPAAVAGATYLTRTALEGVALSPDVPDAPAAPDPS